MGKTKSNFRTSITGDSSGYSGAPAIPQAPIQVSRNNNRGNQIEILKLHISIGFMNFLQILELWKEFFKKNQ